MHLKTLGLCLFLLNAAYLSVCVKSYIFPMGGKAFSYILTENSIIYTVSYILYINVILKYHQCEYV